MKKSTWLLHAVELTSKVLLSKLWRLEHRFPKKIINKIKPLMDTIWLFSSALCRFERKPTIASQNYQKQKSSKALGWWMVPRTCFFIIFVWCLKKCVYMYVYILTQHPNNLSSLGQPTTFRCNPPGLRLWFSCASRKVTKKTP